MYKIQDGRKGKEGWNEKKKKGKIEKEKKAINKKIIS